MQAPKIFLVGLVGLWFANPITFALAQFDYDKLGEVTGRYIGALDFVRAIRESMCGYVFKKPFDFEMEINIITERLREIHKDSAKELSNYMNTKGFTDEQLFHERVIETIITGMIEKDGIDEKTTCGFVTGQYVALMAIEKSSWEAYIKNLR